MSRREDHPSDQTISHADDASGGLAGVGAGNTVIGAPQKLTGTRFSVTGTGNLIFFEPGVRLAGSTIRIEGDDSLLYFSSQFQWVRASIRLGNRSCLYIGNDSFFHPQQIMRITVDDDAIACLGNDLLASINVSIDTAGAGNCLVVGDHSWLCHGSAVRGSSRIAPNTIVAAKATLIDCTTEPFSCWGGANRRLLSDVLFSKLGLRLLGHDQLARRATLPAKEARAIREVVGLPFADLVGPLRDASKPDERLGLIRGAKAGLSGYARVKSKSPVVTPTRLHRLRKRLLGERAARGNEIIGSFENADSSCVQFVGTGNLLVIEPGVSVHADTTIKFRGDNALLYLSSSTKPYRMIMTIHTDSSCFIGHDNTFAEKGAAPRLSPSEGQALVIGDRNSFGSRVWIRTSDQHGIYRADTLERINAAQPVVIANDTRIGAEAIIQKGAYLPDGSVVEPEGLVIRSKAAPHDPLLAAADKLSATRSVQKRHGIAKRLAKARDKRSAEA